MQNNTAQKIKTGIFVMAGLAILLLIIIFIGNQKNLFRSTMRLHVNYRTVAGLQEGSFVRFAGINVGTVELIDIKNDTTVRVDISVQEKIRPFIKVGSKASIGNDGLMGDKLIQIVPGNDSSQQVIAENGELVAVNPFDMDKIMSKVEKVGNIISNIDTLSGNLAAIFGKVNNGQGTLGKLINNEKIADDLQETVASAKKTVKTANKAAEGLNENMEAAKHNFLLKGYFKKKEKKRIADSTAKAKALQKEQANPKN